jgi:DNA polymerase-1
MVPNLAQFSSIWIAAAVVDTRGDKPASPVAVAVRELHSERTIQFGIPKLRGVQNPPYPTGPQALIVTVDARELVACHVALSWRLPERLIDLLVEFKNEANGQHSLLVGGLAGALLCCGQQTLGAASSASSPSQLEQRLNAVATLFSNMGSKLHLGQALIRGRYMIAIARIEATGLPVDMRSLQSMRTNWPAIRQRAIEIVDQSFGVYRGSYFDRKAFLDWLEQSGIHWPRRPDGRPDFSDEVFGYMARTHPVLQTIKELRTTLSSFDPCRLTIGRDGRNRTSARPFASRTGRNQPKNSEWIFGGPKWVRNLVRPKPGTGLALIDWAQQEFGIAAALSDDPAMQRAYSSGDAYVGFAVAAGAVAEDDETARRSDDVKARFKACALGVQYGMGAERLGRQLGVSIGEAKRLIALHRKSFPRFWSWSDSVELHGLLNGELHSVFGWRVSVGADANPRFLRNFPMQANGAEMLRLACCLISESGVKICATLHDALLIEAPLDNLDEDIATAERLMAEASHVVLDSFELRTTVRVARDPDRWSEPRGKAMWSAVKSALEEFEKPAHQRNPTCSQENSRPIYLYVSSKDHTGHGD